MLDSVNKTVRMLKTKVSIYNNETHLTEVRILYVRNNMHLRTHANVLKHVRAEHETDKIKILQLFEYEPVILEMKMDLEDFSKLASVTEKKDSKEVLL